MVNSYVAQHWATLAQKLRNVSRQIRAMIDQALDTPPCEPLAELLSAAVDAGAFDANVRQSRDRWKRRLPKPRPLTRPRHLFDHPKGYQPPSSVSWQQMWWSDLVRTVVPVELRSPPYDWRDQCSALADRIDRDAKGMEESTRPDRTRGSGGPAPTTPAGRSDQGEGDGGVGVTSTKTKTPKTRRGRKRLSKKESERREAILSAWDKARGTGTAMKTFCREHEPPLSLKELEKIVAWKATRDRRTAAR